MSLISVISPCNRAHILSKLYLSQAKTLLENRGCQALSQTEPETPKMDTPALTLHYLSSSQSLRILKALEELRV